MRHNPRARIARRYRPVAQGGDPFIAEVVQLTHFDGANGAAVFPQSIGPNAFQQQGAGSTLTTANKQFGTASVTQAGGVAQGPLRAAADALYAIGTNGFVLELWFCAASLNAPVYCDGRPPSTNGVFPVIGANAADSIAYSCNGSNLIVSGAASVTAAVWTYFALARSAGNARMFLGTSGNAPQVGVTAVDTNNYPAIGLWLAGGAFSGDTRFNGEIDEFRLSIGPGRAATFMAASVPVPTTAFSNS